MSSRKRPHAKGSIPTDQRVTGMLDAPSPSISTCGSPRVQRIPPALKISGRTLCDERTDTCYKHAHSGCQCMPLLLPISSVQAKQCNVYTSTSNDESFMRTQKGWLRYVSRIASEPRHDDGQTRIGLQRQLRHRLIRQAPSLNCPNTIKFSRK
jgi:hypothetical protein